MVKFEFKFDLQKRPNCRKQQLTYQKQEINKFRTHS